MTDEMTWAAQDAGLTAEEAEMAVEDWRGEKMGMEAEMDDDSADYQPVDNTPDHD